MKRLISSFKIIIKKIVLYIIYTLQCTHSQYSFVQISYKTRLLLVLLTFDFV